MLSVIIITKNESADIRDCLASVQWADEIIVLDSGSTDGTPDICREYTPHVHETDWPGFGPQKNRALDLANGEWVLSLDADERVTPELREEIAQAMLSDDFVAYRMPRSSCYCGHFMKYGGWSPDYVTRLFQRDSARFKPIPVHEALEIQSGKIGILKSPLIHYAYENLEEVLEKLNSYSSLKAQMQATGGSKRGSLRNAIFRGLWAFIRTYIIRLGFMDGREGFMLAVSNAEGTYYGYLKLMYLQRKSSIKQ